MMDRKEILKGLIGRLSRGESMEEVRGEFKRHFQDVPAEEIAAAEKLLRRATSRKVWMRSRESMG